MSTKKRVEKRGLELAKQSQQLTNNINPITNSNSQPVISYVDPDKSIDTLIQFGVSQHEQRINNRSANETRQHYNPRKPKLPPSFNRPPPCKSRGSSAGHSREGSSDDGIGSSGRHTLSPSSVSSSTMVAGGAVGPFAYSGPVHTRQRSAPELANPAALERHGPVSRHHMSNSNHQHAHPYSSTPMITNKMIVHGGGPLMASSGDYSSSQSHAAIASSGAVYHPRGAVSCDFDAVDGGRLRGGGGEFVFSPDGQPYLVEQQRPYYGNTVEPERRSVSLDPLAVAGMSADHLQQQPQPMMTNQDVDDGYGMLPEGWMKAIDATTGDVYFIDHINKQTTWFDPRIPEQLQEEQVRLRHSCRAANAAGTGKPTDFENHHPPLSSTQERVQQLEMERYNMLIRQQQLSSQGLLDQQQQSPQQYNNNSHSPINIQSINHVNEYMMSPAGPFHPHPHTHPHTHQHQHHTGAGNPRNPSNDSAFESMDVDPMPGVYHHPPIDLPIVGAYDFHHLNPQEFDRYLQLNEPNKPRC